jgi:two-component system chemotaxis response regulator CheB
VRQIRVVVIDDSAYNRRTITKMLQEIPGVEVVGYASNGEEGLKRVMDLRPDLITLDLEMPKMDGFTMLRIVMHSCPTPTIVISAKSEDERVFKALELGAADFIAKPTSTISDDILKIKSDLFAKVRNVFDLNIDGLRRSNLLTESDTTIENGCILDMSSTPTIDSRFSILAIGSSTGGPPALQTVFASLPATLPFAAVVSQHMPIGFTRAFADRLNRLLPFEVKEASDGDEVRVNRVLIAPGGSNLTFEQIPGCVIARVVAPALKDRFVPSVDAMFSSLAPLYGSKLLAVVLTGMGNDGSRGVKDVKAAGGEVLAEAEESAVVFGMPREAIATGVVSRVVPIEKMAREIILRSKIVHAAD